MQHHHVAGVSVEPHVDGLAHAADLVQRRCVVVQPAKFQDLRGIIRTKSRLKGGRGLFFGSMCTESNKDDPAAAVLRTLGFNCDKSLLCSLRLST